jgi:hypothetical protein
MRQTNFLLPISFKQFRTTHVSGQRHENLYFLFEFELYIWLLQWTALIEIAVHTVSWAVVLIFCDIVIGQVAILSWVAQRKWF